MGFYDVRDHVIDLLRSRQRASYRELKWEFNLDDAFISHADTSGAKPELKARRQKEIDAVYEAASPVPPISSHRRTEP